MELRTLLLTVLAAAALGQGARTYVDCACSATGRGFSRGAREELRGDLRTLTELRNELLLEQGQDPSVTDAVIEERLKTRAREEWDGCVNNYSHEECVNADAFFRHRAGGYRTSFCAYDRATWQSGGKPACDKTPSYTSTDPAIVSGNPEIPSSKPVLQTPPPAPKPPAPAQPAPPAPEQPAPAQPAPPAPEQPAPAQPALPAPEQPVPAQPAPAEPAPEQPAPAQPAPAEPAKPAPADPKPAEPEAPKPPAAEKPEAEKPDAEKPDADETEPSKDDKPKEAALPIPPRLTPTPGTEPASQPAGPGADGDLTSTLDMTESPAPRPRPICFPGGAKVETTTGVKRMDELTVGERVHVGGGVYSEVFMFTHRLAGVREEFVALATSSGARLSLTPGHYLPLNGVYRPARDAAVGDTVALGDGNAATLVKVERVKDTGLYNPQTAHGDIVVDGVRASTYTTAVEPKMAHALLAPLRMLGERLRLYPTFLDAGNDRLARFTSVFV